MTHNIILYVVLYRRLETVYVFYYPDEKRFLFFSFSQRIVLFLCSMNNIENENFSGKLTSETRVTCNPKIQTTIAERARVCNTSANNRHGRWTRTRSRADDNNPPVPAAVHVPSKCLSPSRSHYARDKVKSYDDRHSELFVSAYIRVHMKHGLYEPFRVGPPRALDRSCAHESTIHDGLAIRRRTAGTEPDTSNRRIRSRPSNATRRLVRETVVSTLSAYMVHCSTVVSTTDVKRHGV